MVGYGSGGCFLLMAFLGLSQIAIGAGKDPNPDPLKKCLVCGYPRDVDPTDKGGESCRHPEKDMDKAKRLYGKDCAKIGDFMTLLQASKGYKDPGTPGPGANEILFKPKWERDFIKKNETTYKKLLDKIKYDKYHTVCKKTFITTSAAGVPGTKAWNEIPNNETNKAYERVVRYCGWEPKIDEHESEIKYPYELQPFGSASSLKIVETTTTCITDHCNGAPGVKVGSALFVSLILVLVTLNA